MVMFYSDRQQIILAFHLMTRGFNATEALDLWDQTTEAYGQRYRFFYHGSERILDGQE